MEDGEESRAGMTETQTESINHSNMVEKTREIYQIAWVHYLGQIPTGVRPKVRSNNASVHTSPAYILGQCQCRGVEKAPDRIQSGDFFEGREEVFSFLFELGLWRLGG
jgi:hypothetical protein